MMRVLTTIVFLLFLVPSFAQSDYRIKTERKVKAGYKPFPYDFETKELSWASVLSACIQDAKNGNWFQIDVSTDRFRFTVHTGGRMGDLEDFKLYLGEVIETRVSRELKEIACVEHTGDQGAFFIQATNLDPSKEYFILLVSEKAGKRYAIETSENFTLDEEQKAEPEIAFKIFGRILDPMGKPRENVKISLLDGEENPVSFEMTDESGAFKFEELPRQDVYMTRIEEDDTEMLVEMFLIDGKGKIKSRATRIGERLYAFGANLDGFRQLNLLTPREFALNTQEGKVGMVGRIVDNQSFLFGRSGVKVDLYSKTKTDRVLASSTTNDQGMFRFDNLDKDDYAVQIAGSDQASDFVEIVMVDDLDVPFSYSNSTMIGKNGFFSFEKLPKDLVEMRRLEAIDTRMKVKDDFSDIKKGSSMVLEHLLFATGSAELLPESFEELDDLAAALNENPDLKVEISGHTDNVGSESLNMILSENRAKAVVEYLVGHGVEEARLSYIGLGQTMPISSNDTPEGRKRNRRVEFRVLD